MKTLEEIKDKAAQQYGFSNYKEFCQLTRKIDTDVVFVMDGFFNKVATILQQEQQKLIADNARLQVKLAINNEPQIFNKYGNDDGFIEVNRESIINENNIIR